MELSLEDDQEKEEVKKIKRVGEGGREDTNTNPTLAGISFQPEE